MQADYIHKFFMKLPTQLRELEGYIERDIPLNILSKIGEIRESLDELEFKLKAELVNIFRGEV